eukprot:SAG22_NODE_8743_length_633_cov_0.874532_1_plen_73_part_10
MPALDIGALTAGNKYRHGHSDRGNTSSAEEQDGEEAEYTEENAFYIGSPAGARSGSENGGGAELDDVDFDLAA